jgi:hypothetical protein
LAVDPPYPPSEQPEHAENAREVAQPGLVASRAHSRRATSAAAKRLLRGANDAPRHRTLAVALDLDSCWST